MPSSDNSSRAAVNRRLLIAGAVAASFGSVAAGGIYSSSVKPNHLARALLRDMVGPFRMSRLEFNNFLGRFQAERALPEGLKRGVLTGLGQVGLLGPTLTVAPGRAVDGVVDLRRELLTAFLVDTDFLAPERNGDAPVRFVDRGVACASPFARFEA